MSVQWPLCRTKIGALSIVFSVQGAGDRPTGPDPENRVRDQDTGSPGRPVSSGLQVPGEAGHCRARTRPLGEIPAAFFLKNVLQLHQQRWVILRVDSLTLWKIMNEEDAVLIPKKKSRRELFQRIFALGNFGAGQPLCRHSIDFCFVSTIFRPWSPIAKGNHLDRGEKNSKSCSDGCHSWRFFFSSFRHFGTHFAESFRMSKFSWIKDPTGSRKMPSCSAIDLAEIRRYSKISSWIWSIISGWSLFWVVAHHRWKIHHV